MQHANKHLSFCPFSSISFFLLYRQPEKRTFWRERRREWKTPFSCHSLGLAPRIRHHKRPTAGDSALPKSAFYFDENCAAWLIGMCFHASDKAKANDGVWLGHFRTEGKRLSEFNLLDFVLPGKRAPALQKGGVPMILNLIFRLVYPVAYFFSQFATRKFYGVSRTKRPTEMRFCSGDVCRIGSPRPVIFKVCNRHGGKSEQSHHSPSCFFLWCITNHFLKQLFTCPHTDI